MAIIDGLFDCTSNFLYLQLRYDIISLFTFTWAMVVLREALQDDCDRTACF
jgi:hypothetical protein